VNGNFIEMVMLYCSIHTGHAALKCRHDLQGCTTRKEAIDDIRFNEERDQYLKSDHDCRENKYVMKHPCGFEIYFMPMSYPTKNEILEKCAKQKGLI